MSRKYTEDHEWVDIKDGIATVGVTQHAQEQLGDVVFVDLPNVGDAFTKGDEMAVIESVKAASDVYAPLSGEVTEVNDALTDTPALINTDATGGGWIFKISISEQEELSALLEEEAYNALIT